MVNYMQSTQLSQSQGIVLDSLLAKSPRIKSIISDIIEEGGQVFLVGGAVRDILMGTTVKDIDCEVHGFDTVQLEAVLKKSGPVDLVGKSFGVLRVQGLDIDWSLPRTDSAGRKPIVSIDPHMGIQDAFARRDLTINAMGIDLLTKELIDPFNGKQDLQNKVLRAPDISFFSQDPLRFYRVMQFIGRFEMHPDNELNRLCQQMDITHISRERIEVEFEKMMCKSKRPSLGIRWLRDIKRLKDVLPELYATIGIKQSPLWHPEGDVFEHTMQTLDAAARIECSHSKEERIRLMLAALCHDLGKVTTTKEVNGTITSYDHELQGIIPAKRLLARITGNKERKETVLKLVRYHMAPLQFIANSAKPSAYKRLALKLSPHTNIQMLAHLSCADKCGRNAKSAVPLQGPCKDVFTFVKRAQDAQVLKDKQKPVVQGRDLMEFIEPGPHMGELVKQAYKIQINENIKNKEMLIKRVLEQ